jgi:hypothetical protein
MPKDKIKVKILLEASLVIDRDDLEPFKKAGNAHIIDTVFRNSQDIDVSVIPTEKKES